MEERSVIGAKPLVMREGLGLETAEVCRVLPGAKVRVLETQKTDDGGVRARVVLIYQGKPPPPDKGKRPKKGAPSMRQLAAAPPSATGWITSIQKGGKSRLTKPPKGSEANERRLHLELWNRRLAADRAIAAAARRQAEMSGGGGGSSSSSGGGGAAAAADKSTAVAHTGRTGTVRQGTVRPDASGQVEAETLDEAAVAAAGPSFAHELADDRRGIAFAYGGVYPGTLHAHGELVKVHQVQYSIGAVGKYLLHVGLRQKAAALPGSPFRIEVKPGPAHAPSTSLPADALPLQCVVGTTGTLLMRLCDNVGNLCVEGGAPLKVSVSTTSIRVKVEDKEDGTYLVTWRGTVAGDFLMTALINGVHIRRSPCPLAMLPAAPDIAKSELAPEVVEDGRAIAVAGSAAKLEVRLRDAFGNATPPTATMGLGLVLVAMPSNDKSKSSEKKSADHGEEGGKKPSKMTAAERANLVRTMPSLPFEGTWDMSTFALSYTPKEAGDFELHVWCDPDGSGNRLFLPGCPHPLHVNAGPASASGSYIKDAASFAQVVAGERLVLRVQARDEYGNSSALTSPDEELSAHLVTPSSDEVPLNLKALTSSTSTESNKGSGQGGGAQGGGGGDGGNNNNNNNNNQREKKKDLARGGTMFFALGSYEVVSPAELTPRGRTQRSSSCTARPSSARPAVRCQARPGRRRALDPNPLEGGGRARADRGCPTPRPQVRKQRRARRGARRCEGLRAQGVRVPGRRLRDGPVHAHLHRLSARRLQGAGAPRERRHDAAARPRRRKGRGVARRRHRAAGAAAGARGSSRLQGIASGVGEQEECRQQHAGACPCDGGGGRCARGDRGAPSGGGRRRRRRRRSFSARGTSHQTGRQTGGEGQVMQAWCACARACARVRRGRIPDQPMRRGARMSSNNKVCVFNRSPTCARACDRAFLIFCTGSPTRGSIRSRPPSPPLSVSL